MRERGSASIFSLVVLIGLCLVAGAIALRAVELRFLLAKTEAAAEGRGRCDAKVDAWIKLYRDTAKEADSNFSVTTRDFGGDVADFSVEDISSRINPNWLDARFLSQPSLASIFADGENAESFLADRKQHGFSMDIAGRFGKFFRPEDFDRLLTSYGYADVNSSDPDSLSALFAAMSGSTIAPSAFASMAGTPSRERHPITITELESLAGPYFPKVFPMIAVAPPINVNFAPEQLLLAVLQYPPFGIEDPAGLSKAIARVRESTEIDSARLTALLGVPRENPVYLALGVRTWFWRLRISEEGLRLEAIVARRPPAPDRELEDSSSPIMTIVGRKFTR